MLDQTHHIPVHLSHPYSPARHHTHVGAKHILCHRHTALILFGTAGLLPALKVL